VLYGYWEYPKETNRDPQLTELERIVKLLPENEREKFLRIIVDLAYVTERRSR
jgi:hypothetical protein